MADTNININIKAIENVSAPVANALRSIEKLGQTVDNIGRTMKTVGREINQVGNAFSLLGVSITAPLTLAYTASAKYSAGITRQINEMKDSYENLQVQVGEALLPIMRQFQDILENLINRWNQLNPAQQQHIIQTVYMAGVWITVGGVATKALGQILKIMSDVLSLTASLVAGIYKIAVAFVALAVTNPVLLAIYVVVGLIVAAMFKWKAVGDFVMNTMQKIGDVISVVFRGALLVIERLALAFTSMIENILNLASKIPGIGEKFEAARDAVSRWRVELQNAANTNFDKITADLKDLVTFNPDQNGSWANTFNGIKLSIGGAIDGVRTFKNDLTDVLSFLDGASKGTGGAKRAPIQSNMFAGFMQGLETAKASLGNFFTTGQKLAVDMVNGMKTTFSSFFMDFFTGQLKTAKDYFAAFGNAMLKSFSDAIAGMITQWLTFKIITGIGGLFAGGMGTAGANASAAGAGTTFSAGGSFSNVARFHSGGMIQKAHEGLAVGEVPIIAQTGEGVLSRQGMANLAKLNKGGGVGGGGVQITIAPVMQLWDASDVQRNKKIMVDAIAQEIMNNGQMRQIIKQYGN